MGAHLIDDEFQSDKYPTTPRGKVPLSTSDPAAQDLLWIYAQRRRAGSHGSREVDREFADDVETALRLKGFAPPRPRMAYRDREWLGIVIVVAGCVAQEIHAGEWGWLGLNVGLLLLVTLIAPPSWLSRRKGM